ncbi:MAG TPA: mersacidin/lichenicidin family type 2 lantibiotic [Planctomycetia bacterium]|nr:mersacidin/lichenicidin family type 2 lantibiotic [Planctomycetia bacterium]
MNQIDVVRAWKDEAYRNELPEAARAALPANPAGVVDLADVQAENVNGGATSLIVTILFGCLSGKVSCNKAYCGYLNSLKTKSSTC